MVKDREEWDNQLSCFLAQILIALAYGFSLDIVNTDMHFNNIMVPTGYRLFEFLPGITCPRLKFIDLGLAKPNREPGTEIPYKLLRSALDTIFGLKHADAFIPTGVYHPCLTNLMRSVFQKPNDWNYVTGYYVSHLTGTYPMEEPSYKSPPKGKPNIPKLHWIFQTANEARCLIHTPHE